MEESSRGAGETDLFIVATSQHIRLQGCVVIIREKLKIERKIMVR